VKAGDSRSYYGTIRTPGVFVPLKVMRRFFDNGKAVPEAMASFQAFEKAALADGAIPKKHKELMAVAVGLTTQCPYCLEVHRKTFIRKGLK
jgi:AhpD family alkylhydroperoxidase